MKFLRTVALFSAALTVVLAQFLLFSVELINAFPGWLLDLLPSLRSLAFWSEGNLQGLALVLVAVGALIFGLLAQTWEPSQILPVRTVYPQHVRAGAILVGVAVLLGVVFALFTWQNDTEPLWLHLGWAMSVVLLLVGAGLVTAQRFTLGETPAPRPEAAWPLLLLVLAGAGLLTAWHLVDLPVRVTDSAVVYGLQAKALAVGAESRIFVPGADNLPLFAFYPSALAMRFSGDTLLGSRIAGVLAGLLTVFGVWLLGCELFRRPPVRVDGFLWRDDGRSAALCSATIVAIGYTFIHFSRQPILLEPVGWGTLALWALHRGVRTGSLLVLALSGLLLGITALLYLTGWIFVAVALLWLVWLVLGRTHWIRPEDGIGWAALLIWPAAFFVFVAPAIGVWLRLPGVFAQRFLSASIFDASALARMEVYYSIQGLPAVLWESFRRSLLTFNFYPDTSAAFGFDGPMFDPLIGALLVMGLGVIVLNLDRLLSWLLLTWWGVVLILGGGITEGAPFWPYLLPLLPVSALVAGLAVERWRSTLLFTGGPWLRHVGTVAVLGLLLWAGAQNWISYYERYTLLDAPPAEKAVHYTGRALRTLSTEQVPYLIVGEGRPQWDDPRLVYIAGRAYDVLAHGELRLDSLPETLPPESAVLLLPEDQVLASVLADRYPGGVYRILRDRQSNPVMVIMVIGD